MSNRKRMHPVTALGCSLVLGLLSACAADHAGKPQPLVPPGAAVPESWQKAAQKEETRKESARPPVAPATGEPRTALEAQQRAADPKAPTGALIVKPPINVLPPDTQTASD